MKPVKCICADCGGIFLAFGGVKPECPECNKPDPVALKHWCPAHGSFDTEVCQGCIDALKRVGEEDDSGLEDAIMDIVDFQEKTGARVCESGTVMTMGSFPGPIKNRKAWNKVWSEDDPVMEEFANSMGSRYREIWE